MDIEKGAIKGYSHSCRITCDKNRVRKALRNWTELTWSTLNGEMISRLCRVWEQAERLPSTRQLNWTELDHTRWRNGLFCRLSLCGFVEIASCHSAIDLNWARRGGENNGLLSMFPLPSLRTDREMYNLPLDNWFELSQTRGAEMVDFRLSLRRVWEQVER